MRLKTVSIQNFRLIADSTIEIPTGLTLVNGENGLGKSSIFQAILWCLYGPDALGDNQTSLVRQGHRDLSVEVVMEMYGDSREGFTVSRKFRLNPNGKSGSTELKPVLNTMLGDSDRSGESVAEAQANINGLIGGLDIFAATAYVDQHDGPGAFWRFKPAEQREHIRGFFNINPDWDTWHDLAKLKHKTVADRIVGNLGRASAAQEFIDANAGADGDRAKYAAEVLAFLATVSVLNVNLEDLQDAQDEVDRVVAENERRTKALNENRGQLSIDEAVLEQVEARKVTLTDLVANLPTLDEERKVWLAGCDFWDDRNTEYQVDMKEYVRLHDAFGEVTGDLLALRSYYGQVDEIRSWLAKTIEIIDGKLSNSPAATHCPTCLQKLLTNESQSLANASRQQLADGRAEHVESLKMLPEPVDPAEIQETITVHLETNPDQPNDPGTRPVFESETEWNAAKSAETDIAAVDAEIKTRADQVKTLEVAREELPTPDEIDIVVTDLNAATIGKVNREIAEAEIDKREREKKLAAAENTLEQIEERKITMAELEVTMGEDQKLEKELEIVVTGTGPNGARQLMIDQQLGDFQAEVNQWLGILLPGFSIYMDTQAESGRESFTTAFATPTGVIGWNGLSGAQRVGVGLSTRLALASMVQQRQGHSFDTWMLDEVDGSMRGEKREAFVAMLYKLQQQGIDLLVVSHADTVVERMEQRIEVVDAGGFTEVR